MPGRIEMALAIALFAATVIWLMCRRHGMPENGDLLGTAAVLWCAGRLVTDGFHRAESGLFGMGGYTGWIAAGVMAIALIGWTARAGRQKINTGYAWACVPVFLGAVAAIALIRNGISPWKNPPAELTIMICAAMLAMKAALCMGRVSRNQDTRAGQPSFLQNLQESRSISSPGIQSSTSPSGRGDSV